MPELGPRHLFGGVGFHCINLIDVGSHEAGSDTVQTPRPTPLAAALAGIVEHFNHAWDRSSFRTETSDDLDRLRGHGWTLGRQSGTSRMAARGANRGVVFVGAIGYDRTYVR